MIFSLHSDIESNFSVIVYCIYISMYKCVCAHGLVDRFVALEKKKSQKWRMGKSAQTMLHSIVVIHGIHIYMMMNEEQKQIEREREG